MNLHLDFETRSEADLKKVGLHAYAEHPSTEILCAAYAVDDGPVQTWHPNASKDAWREFERALWAGDYAHGDTITAHNAAFERIILRTVGPKYGFGARPIELFRCTMVMAYALGLPGSLDDACASVALDVRKDNVGKRVMMKMTKPRRPTKHEAPGLYWHDSPEDHERLRAYCAQDVEAERALEKRLLPLSKSELELWFLDQEINDRGVAIDAELAEGAVKIVDVIAKRLDERMAKVSCLEVRGVTDRAGLLRFAAQQGCPDIDSLAKDNVVKLLTRDDLTPALRECLEIRQEGAKASVAKVDALLRSRCADGRGRGFLQFYAANTGRWGGRRFQPQNLKRPETDEEWIDGVIDSVRRGVWTETDDLFYGPALSAVGDVIRGMVMAGE